MLLHAFVAENSVLNTWLALWLLLLRRCFLSKACYLVSLELVCKARRDKSLFCGVAAAQKQSVWISRAQEGTETKAGRQPLRSKNSTGASQRPPKPSGRLEKQPSAEPPRKDQRQAAKSKMDQPTGTGQIVTRSRGSKQQMEDNWAKLGPGA